MRLLYPFHTHIQTNQRRKLELSPGRESLVQQSRYSAAHLKYELPLHHKKDRLEASALPVTDLYVQGDDLHHRRSTRCALTLWHGATK